MEGKVHKMEGYPIGQQDFRRVRESECIYVDKTSYIERILRQKSQYLFLARPRRFGKSLFLSTMRYFFEGRRELFKGLDIDDYDWKWDAYPVLYLDLNPLQYDSPDQLNSYLDNCFQTWEMEYGVTLQSEIPSIRFRNIIEAAHRKCGLGAVILIDEYDKPLVSNLKDSILHDRFKTDLSAIYSNLKSSAEHIRLAFLTGVSRFSKLSVFSDLNNLNDISFDDEYADICGITANELSEYFQEGIGKLAQAEEISRSEAHNLLKSNYDGYKFARRGSDIYNPWSVLCALEKSRIGAYWSSTGLPRIIGEALIETEVNLENLLNTECDFEMLQGLDLSHLDPLPLLYQTGYLTLKSYDKETQLYRLGIPNKEVTTSLFNFLLPYYLTNKEFKTETVVSDILRFIRLGKPEKMLEYIDIFLAGIPYELRMENENNFQNALYILLSLIGTQAKAEVHTSDGRIDLLLSTSKFIYIIELKFGKTSKNVLDQIERKAYDRAFSNDSRKIFQIGVNFNTSTRRLDSPLITCISQ